MIPIKAIEKAESAGYEAKLYFDDHTKWVGMTQAEIALDPSFWQSLGKALGWEGRGYRFFGRNEPKWVQHAMAFYILILTGQPTDKFWDDLLT